MRDRRFRRPDFSQRLIDRQMDKVLSKARKEQEAKNAPMSQFDRIKARLLARKPKGAQA